MSTIWYQSLFQGKSENEIPGMSELECRYITAVRAAVFFLLSLSGSHLRVLMSCLNFEILF